MTRLRGRVIRQPTERIGQLLEEATRAKRPAWLKTPSENVFGGRCEWQFGQVSVASELFEGAGVTGRRSLRTSQRRASQHEHVHVERPSWAWWHREQDVRNEEEDDVWIV
jgi:hypothetical protein